MRAYLIRRLLLIIPTLLLVSIIVFFTIRLIPGDIIDLIQAQAGAQAGATMIADRDALLHEMGLDVPMHVQYLRWIGRIILHGDLGTSLIGNKSVGKEILHRLPVSLELGTMAMALSLAISIPIGIFSAIRQDTIGDYIARSFAIICISVPSFWVGAMVLLYPSIWWSWVVPVEYIPFIKDPLENLRMFIIPSIIMGMLSAGGTMRITRTMMLEVLRQDYVRTAWSKGLRERAVVVKHALRNALIPIVTIIGMGIPGLIGGAVIMETIFALPGMGRLMLGALAQRDYIVVSGINLLVAFIVMMMNLVVDITYGYLDPRVHYK